jgi:formylglycine-generating enzyme required for sulfatase activity
VTVGQFRRFVAAAGYRTEAERDGRGGWGWDQKQGKWVQDPKFTWRSPGFEQTDEHPVVNVTWNDATAFCEWLSWLERMTYRLPTQTEWEYACRAGATTRYSFGDAAAKLGEYAWFTGNSDDRTHPVGRKKPNGWGLFDMHGNVWEWCSDGYAADYYRQSPVDDPPGPLRAPERVMRGGGWDGGLRSARSTYRYGDAPVYRSYDLGFRVARVQSGR